MILSTNLSLELFFLFISVNSSSTILSETSSHDLFNHCVGNVDWIGDGICDSDLLTKQCFYDGGDCCDGIVKEYCIDSGTYVHNFMKLYLPISGNLYKLIK